MSWITLAMCTRAGLPLSHNVPERTQMDVIPLKCSQHIKVKADVAENYSFDNIKH
ncbi:TPA: hypothetical protein U2R98_003500 [Yersinia enterocolitica]|nr:hypothetical protein [Yersinia enterocolitica]HEM8996954.1 hypothetical protein [Yersinia enterocolitica]HEO8480705.1 hypothetical protein [Yersinia enterocolitica]